MSRERVFHLAELIVKELTVLDAVSVKVPDEIRPEVIRVLSDEARLEDTIDAEVRKTLSTYARPAPEGSQEWEVLYQKTREEVFRRRFRV